MTELEKAARKCVFDELCVWCCKRVYTHCEYMAKTKDEPICKEGKVVHAKFIAGAQWKAKQSQWISVEERLPDPGKLVNVRCRNKNKEDGIWLCDVCFIDEDTNTWGERHHTWETITHWMPIPE